MLRALWTSASGMIAQQTNLDVTTNNLANAWYRYGELTHEADYLRKAVPLYEAILDVRTRERDAGGWASTNNNLANALFSLGTHGGGRVDGDEHDQKPRPVRPVRSACTVGVWPHRQLIRSLRRTRGSSAGCRGSNGRRARRSGRHA